MKTTIEKTIAEGDQYELVAVYQVDTEQRWEIFPLVTDCESYHKHHEKVKNVRLEYLLLVTPNQEEIDVTNKLTEKEKEELINNI